MTYRGRIKNGVAVLETPGSLPEGTPVRIEALESDATFWNSQSVEELAAAQGVRPFNGPQDLAGDWPQEDSVDDLLALIREARR